MKNICIIPARGGSKRIKNKNIKEFNGKPIISYSIDLAIKSNLFDEIMVSTDSIQVAEVAKKQGAKIPFMRSDSNSNDFATTYDVIDEVLQYYKNKDEIFNYLCCIYPTAALITKETLLKGYKIIRKNLNTSVFPVVEFEYPIQKAFTFNNENLKFLKPNLKLSRTQDFESFYHDAGQFYWINTKKILKSKEILAKDSYGIVVSNMHAHDIDKIEDWKIAELKFNYLKNKI